MLTFTFQCENEAQFTPLQQAAHFLAQMLSLPRPPPAVPSGTPSKAMPSTAAGNSCVTPCSPLPNNASTRTKKRRRPPLRVRRVVPT
jgi:hypothetical protein